MAYDRDTFVAMIDQNGNIRDMSAGRRGEIIGIDTQREQEYVQTQSDMQETIDNYFAKLVELGAIELPKTPEQIAQESASEQLRLIREQADQQATINQALLSAIQNLNTELEELKTIGNDGSSGAKTSQSGAKQNGSNSKNNGTIVEGSKGSSVARGKDVA